MKPLLCLALLFIFDELLFAENAKETSNYIAAVVEVSPVSENFIKSEIRKHTDQAVDIITSSELDRVDIVVLPEAVFNRQISAVLWPSTKQTFCHDPEVDYMLRKISCAVQKARKYVVVNLYVKIKCKDDDQPVCGNDYDKTNLYNMAIVFDRNGDVVAKYRKYHLYNEDGVQQTKHPELISFKTDFDVTFGVGICLDLAFADPMIRLVEKGITNFVFPTHWISKLPYFTALQYMQSWAYANNVNLLGANANIPYEGCSGSGIFHGRAGALETFIDGRPMTRFLIAKVPINMPVNDGNHAFCSGASTAITKLNHLKNDNNNDLTMRDTIQFTEDNLYKFTGKFLNFSESLKQTGQVCNNGICCTYAIEVSDNGDKQMLSYSYAVAVFSGQRTYEGIKHSRIGQDVCSVISCRDREYFYLRFCGRRIPNIYFRYKFIKLQLKTELPMTFKKVMANTLTHDLLPLNVAEYKLSEVKKDNMHAVTLHLDVSKEDLLTFAILSRDYDKDVIIKPSH